MSYVVCIPSYKRANLCNELTLRTLRKNKINSTLIYVFVANKTEYNIYKDTLDPDLYNKLIIGEKGLVQQRDYISNHFSHGQYIVFFDDDIKDIDLKLSPKFKSSSLHTFFKNAFKDCVKLKSFIWGVYPVYNPFFRGDKSELSTALKYIVGAFYGIINRPNYSKIRLNITRKNGQKEDVERTIKYFINDGIVLRYNKIGFQTKYYGDVGGLGTFNDRLKPMKEASLKLQQKYPMYGKVTERKSGMTEFTLKIIPSTLNISKSSNSAKTKNKRNINTKSGKQKTQKLKNSK